MFFNEAHIVFLNNGIKFIQAKHGLFLKERVRRMDLQKGFHCFPGLFQGSASNWQWLSGEIRNAT